MEMSAIVEVLQQLAHGKNPKTGELLPADSIYNDPDVIRALFESWKLLERRVRSGKNQGRTWHEDEEARLAAAFDGGETLTAIAKSHERSRASIVARLVKIGKLAVDDPRAGSLRYASGVG